ncbi:glycosyltransferase [Candidatus Poribacteria bacterium]|nr:glycosyltransferase [Candidatus Poribacteria bacterium]
MLFSIVIPVHKTGKIDKVTNSLNNISYPQEKIEIIVAYGNQPSVQRNRAVEKTSGDLVYFFDNDSIITPEIFNHVLKHFQDTKVAAVGGPNLTPPEDTFWQHCFGMGMASRFANGKVSARYRKTGKVRVSDETELILCNLCVRRDVYVNIGGLNETIYPNEENEFMNRLIKNGFKLIYDPEVFIYRSRRENFYKVIKQHLNYGRGRMEQTLIEKLSIQTIYFFIPLFFLFYLLLLPFFPNICYYYIPISLYLILSFISSFRLAFVNRNPAIFFIMPIVYLTMHISYGAGIIWGLYRQKIKHIEPVKSDIEIVILKKFGEIN